MAISVRAQFDYIVLKPISFLLTWNAIVGFYRKDWRMGLFWIFTLFALGIVGAALYKSSSIRELTTGASKMEETASPNLSEFNWKDSNAVVLSSFRVSLVIGFIASILAHQQHGWVHSVLLGIGVLLVSWFLITAFFLFVSRQYLFGRLHSLFPGLILFWLGIVLVVVPIAYVFRMLHS